MANLTHCLPSMMNWSLMLRRCTHMKLCRLMVTSSGAEVNIHPLITDALYFGIGCKQITSLCLLREEEEEEG